LGNRKTKDENPWERKLRIKAQLPCMSRYCKESNRPGVQISPGAFIFFIYIKNTKIL